MPPDERAKPLDVVPADGAEVAQERLSREQIRSRRKRSVRAHTVSMVRLTKRELELGKVLYPDVPHWRPTTRGECALMTRPCPFVSCKHHLYIDVNPRNGSIKMNFPDLEPDELEVSCALDVADRGGETLETVGAIMNFTRERTRQIETKALVRLKVLSPVPDDVAFRKPARAHQKPRHVEREDASDEELDADFVQDPLPGEVEQFLEES